MKVAQLVFICRLDDQSTQGCNSILTLSRPVEVTHFVYASPLAFRAWAFKIFITTLLFQSERWAGFVFSATTWILSSKKKEEEKKKQYNNNKYLNKKRKKERKENNKKMYTFLHIYSPGRQTTKASELIFFHWKANKIFFSIIYSLP